MASFKDRTGRQWEVELNVGLVEDIKKQTNVDLDLLLEDAKKLAEFFQKSPHKIAELMYVVCEDQIKNEKIAPEHFGKLFYRDVLDGAVDALIEAIVSFYPRASAGNALRKKLPQILRKMDSEIESEANSAIEKVLSNTHISSPVS